MTTLDNTIQWLEEEQRQQKAAVLKLQQQLDQIQGNSWTLSDRVNAVENAMNAVATHGAHVAHVEEELRQTRESIERLHTRLEEREQRDASEEHTSQVQYERDREARVELTQKQAVIEKEQSALLERSQASEEMARRRQEESFQLAQAIEALRAADDKFSSLILSQQDQTKHHAQGLEETHHSFGSLQAEDELLQSRIQHIAEQVRRLESHEPLREMEERLAQTVTEQGELHRVERLRLERRVIEVQMSYEQYRSNMEDLRQEVIQVHGKGQALTEHLEYVRDQLWELRNNLAEQFGTIQSAEEQQRRRQVAELEQQIKELSAWKPKATRG